MKSNLTTQQIENIQIDYGIVFVNYGDLNERQLAPTKGGAFTVKEKSRDIDFDGKRGKTKDMQVVEEVEASLKVNVLDMSLENLNLALMSATYENGVIKGVVPDGTIESTKYLPNVTMFCKTKGGTYKKISLFNAMAENGLSFKTNDKGEGEIELEIFAHFDATDNTAELYTIENVESVDTIDIVDVTGVTVPATATVQVGKTVTITPTVAPAGATNKRVAFGSATPAKATVNNQGVVTGVATGTSVITCVTLDGGFIGTTTVTVTA